MGIESLHPAVTVTWLAAYTVCTLSFSHPSYTAVSLVCVTALAAKRLGRRATKSFLLLLLLDFFFVVYYAANKHFGKTVLFTDAINNNVTFEAIAKGAATGTSVLCVAMIVVCAYSFMSADKIVCLASGISPRLSLVFSVVFCALPRIATDLRGFAHARRGIGKGTVGIIPRARNYIAVISALITRTTDRLYSSSEAMRARGVLIRGRSAYSLYRFGRRDRLFFLVMVASLTAVGVGASLGQTSVVYDPRIIFPYTVPPSYVFLFAYAVFCSMPSVLEAADEIKLK